MTLVCGSQHHQCGDSTGGAANSSGVGEAYLRYVTPLGRDEHGTLDHLKVREDPREGSGGMGTTPPSLWATFTPIGDPSFRVHVHVRS